MKKQGLTQEQPEWPWPERHVADACWIRRRRGQIRVDSCRVPSLPRRRERSDEAGMKGCAVGDHLQGEGCAERATNAGVHQGFSQYKMCTVTDFSTFACNCT
eukprot:3592798-Rhodomonas_salina.1